MSGKAWQHQTVPRRTAVQAGAIGLLGFGMNHVSALRSAAETRSEPQSRACIFIFLSGGLTQIDSFDPKPLAPAGIRGEFKAIETLTPGTLICEHLPMLARCSSLWSLCRSVTHPSNSHPDSHCIMMTGRTQLPPGFNGAKPQPTDWPSIAATANNLLPPRNNLPPAMILPEKLIHNLGTVIPGQGAGEMGATRDPWFIEASRFNPKSYGAYPEYLFHHWLGPQSAKDLVFQAPNLTLPQGMENERFRRRVDLLDLVGVQQVALDRTVATQKYDRFRQDAVGLLTEERTKRAFDVHSADPRTLDRYGRNSFGWSLLMARQLVEAGVSLVQVHLGNDESWDTHGNAFPNLKNYLFPPTDRSVSALLTDLDERGLLESTLVVMAGEFGRTPHIFGGGLYTSPGRDHWGGVQSVLLAGGGVQGGRVVGASDASGAYPALHPQQPENLAATIYESLGLPRTSAWFDATERPHFIYHGDPIPGLT